MDDPLEDPLLLPLLLLPAPDVAGCLLPDASDFFSEPPVDLSDEEASAVFFSLDSDPPSLFVPLAPTLAFLSARLSVR